jgi:methionine sulfoxide reductase heme-binding subunit
MASRRRVTRLEHHAILSSASVLGVLVIALLIDAPRTRSRASVGLAYVGMALMLVTLAIGPLRRIRGRPVPLSLDLRRDVGIWAGVTSIAHVVLSLGNHFGGDVVAYFFDPAVISVRAVRVDRFGIGSWTGAASAMAVVLLLATSSDAAVKRLGRTWLALHRWNWAVAVVTLAHTVAFWSALDRGPVLPSLTVVAAGVVAAVRIRGRAGSSAGDARRPRGAGRSA